MFRIGDAMVVSSSKAVRALTGSALVAWGDARVRPASTRQEALHMLAERTPGLAVIDYEMPDAMVVAAACYHAAVPFVTINDDERAAAHGGARACVSSPFNAARLVDALDVALGARVRD